jgi:sulfur relay (sulfurtransferase) DsrC/TusE family protein
MQMRESNGVRFSRPKDKSLEAYKAWISEIAARLTTQKSIKLTEEEWRKSWKDFWQQKLKR